METTKRFPSKTGLKNVFSAHMICVVLFENWENSFLVLFQANKQNVVITMERGYLQNTGYAENRKNWMH